MNENKPVYPTLIDTTRVLFDQEGTVFEPNYIKKRADLKYGEPVTHELFNEYMNINITQGDYNTQVLHDWNTKPNPTEVAHILYIDKTMQYIFDEHWKLSDSIDARFQEVNDHLDEHDVTLEDHEKRITQAESDIIKNNTDTNERIDMIINGPTIVYQAKRADGLTNIGDAKPYQYYGTDREGNEGYWDIPPAIFAKDLDENWKSPSGTIIVEPSAGSISKVMLDEYLSGKIDEITRNYNDLDNKPYVNNVELKGRKTLSELGIQPAGNYLTKVPDNYSNNDQLAVILSGYLTTTNARNTYAPLSSFNTLSSKVDAMNTEYSRIFINDSIPAGYTPKNGDVVVYV